MHNRAEYLRNGAAVLFLKKYVCNPPALLAALILGTLIFSGSEIGAFVSVGSFDFLGGLQTAYILSLASYLTPVLVCFPYILRFSGELREGYAVFSTLRVGRGRYPARKLRDAMLSGAVTMLMGVAIYTILAGVYCACNGMAVSCNGDGFFGDSYNPGTGIYYEWVAAGNGWAVYMANLLFLMSYSMFWCVAGTVISAFVKNSRIAIILPFLLDQIIIYVVPDECTFLLPVHLRLDAWAQELSYGGLWYVVLYILIAFLTGWAILFGKLSVEAVR